MALMGLLPESRFFHVGSLVVGAALITCGNWLDAKGKKDDLK
jgi:hypothetical protein